MTRAILFGTDEWPTRFWVHYWRVGDMNPFARYGPYDSVEAAMAAHPLPWCEPDRDEDTDPDVVAVAEF